MTDPDDTYAERFHDTYERLTPQFGYETRRDSAVPWEDVPEANKALMRAVCAEVLADLINRFSEQADRLRSDLDERTEERNNARAIAANQRAIRARLQCGDDLTGEARVILYNRFEWETDSWAAYWQRFAGEPTTAADQGDAVDQVAIRIPRKAAEWAAEAWQIGHTWPTNEIPAMSDTPVSNEAAERYVATVEDA